MINISKLKPADKVCVTAYAACGMNTEAAARAAHYCRTNVVYHLNRVKQLTGKDPHSFYQLHELMRAINSEGNADE